MPATEAPTLSLAEWLVLCLVCEKPQHGFAIARLLGSDAMRSDAQARANRPALATRSRRPARPVLLTRFAMWVSTVLREI